MREVIILTLMLTASTVMAQTSTSQDLQSLYFKYNPHIECHTDFSKVELQPVVKAVVTQKGQKITVVESETGKKGTVSFKKPVVDCYGQQLYALEYIIQRLVDKKIITVKELKAKGLITEL